MFRFLVPVILVVLAAGAFAFDRGQPAAPGAVPAPVTMSWGGANPLVLPSQWQGNPITAAFAVGGIYNTHACATCTAIQQVSAWASQSGTEHTYALFGQVQNNNGSPGNGVWASNLVAYANNGGFAHGQEIDFGIADLENTGNPLTGIAYGQAINVAGVSGGNMVRGLQFSSLDPGQASYSDALVFLQYGRGSIYRNSLIATDGPVDAVHGIDFSSARFGSDAFKSEGFRVDKRGHVFAAAVKIARSRVAALPACDGESEGAAFYVSDSSTAVFNAPIAGGGAHKVLALCNGTSWTVH